MAESNINLPSHLQSLVNTLSLVPAAAVSSVIDCVIVSSTDISSSLLFSSLLSSFRDINQGTGVDHVISYASALCHLTKMSEDPAGDLQLLIWKVFVPTMKDTNANDMGMITQLEGLLFDVASKMQLMEITSEILVPYCLRSICLGINMIQSQDLAIYEWTSKDYISCPGIFPQPIACHVLISLLDCLTSHTKIKTMQKLEGLAANILWDLSNLAYGMLLMSSEARSISVRLLLPTVFRLFNTFFSINVSLDREPLVLTRSSFGKKIWQFCISLFSLGHAERLDAYGVLYLYVSSFSKSDLNTQLSVDHDEEFDVRYEKVFWDEIHRGLVDKDVRLRKHALHILKMSLWDQFSNAEASASSPNEHNISCNGSSSQVTHISKRGKWAEKEAKSLGVGEVCHLSDGCLSTQDRWKVFLLLYEMLEEYGTHLVDAAWTHQISMLFEPCSSVNNKDSARKDVYQYQMETAEGIFSWLAILWERGFFHDNPLVRCLIMQSFLSIDWQNCKPSAQIIPRRFVLGPLILGLNDPVHHKDFGLDGKYTSKTIQEATYFFSSLCWEFSTRERADIVWSLTSVAKNESFGRAGLMTLSFCIASVACTMNNFPRQEHMEYNQDISSKESELLDVLGVIIERSKQHFNPKYRLQVCEQIIKAAASVVNRDNISTEVLLYFLSAVPREFTDRAGFLRDTVRSWLTEGNNKGTDHGPCADKDLILKYLVSFPASFPNQIHLFDTLAFDDDDVEAWEFEARRWARVLFLIADVALCLDPILMFFKEHCLNLCREDLNTCIYSVKLLILIKCVVDELHREWGKIVSHNETYNGTASERIKILDRSPFTSTFSDFDKFVRPFIHIMKEVVSFSKFVTPVLWSGSSIADSQLADSIKGKLGGKSLRRLAQSTVPSVWQAIMSVGTVAQLLMWFAHMKEYDHLHSSLIFTWEFSWKVIQNNTINTETDAELCLAAYEALSYVFKAWTMTLNSSFFSYIVSCNKLLFPDAEDLPILDPLLVSFLENINHLLENGVLKRSRRAVLMNWKWHCLDSLLSIPYHGTQNGVHVSKAVPFFSNFFLRSTFTDIVESLENAAENSVLYILRSLRSVIRLLCPISTTSVISYGGVDLKMMQQLVHSSWILHLSCNKRRVASIAAILSTVLHHSVFSDLSMHGTHDSQQGPLKWFIAKLLENGVKSPRTIRLAALHLTGLWLLHPETLKYYIKELKLLSLYGSVAFDEDFEAELNDNHDAKTEVSFLAQSPDRELTEVFINTELYARVSVAVLFYKLAEMANRRKKHHNGNSLAAHNCGKAFLLELLDSAVNDKELSKELYKKYSATHRRKVRAWQMICVLSHFVDNDIVQEVTTKLHTCLCRNNLPGVRQYLETFAIQVYLDFPSLAEEQLIPIFYDYTMKPQALSSYVFIATNVILHARDRLVQINHMNMLLPPIIPFLTSHHHSLRGFTQLLVHHVLCKMWPALETNSSNGALLEKKCFEDLKSYLAENVDCVRLRKSMECFLDAFDPITSTSPSGVFSARSEGSDFECAPISLMEHVIAFLNDVRDNLRNSIANDAITMENESITEEMPNQNSERSLQTAYDISLDFQKKITLYENARQAEDTRSECFLSEMEKEDQLLNPIIQSRNQAMARIRESQQQFILVASLLDRIPNLAGLARTCEIFKAAGLAVANASVLQDKQFQLISVTAEKWVPIIEVPVNSMKIFLEKKRKEGFSILGLEQTANSTSLEKFSFPDKTVLVLGREREGIPVDIIHVLDACIEIPQLGIIRSLNVHVSGAIALWEYTRQQRLKKQ